MGLSGHPILISMHSNKGLQQLYWHCLYLPVTSFMAAHALCESDYWIFGTRVLLQYWVFATHCAYLEHNFDTSVKFGFLDLFQFLV
jgi:hypothetical protein